MMRSSAKARSARAGMHGEKPTWSGLGLGLGLGLECEGGHARREAHHEAVLDGKLRDVVVEAGCVLDLQRGARGYEGR